MPKKITLKPCFIETTFGYRNNPISPPADFFDAQRGHSAFLGDEAGHQVAIFNYADKMAHHCAEWADLFAVPNGGKRDAVTAINLKRQGVKAGVLDMMLLIPRKGYSGLMVELKVKNRPPTPDQLSFAEKARNNGFKAIFCNGSDAAVMAIEEYLS